MTPLKLGVLLSGRGSNMEAILKNCLSGKLNAEIAVVISNKKEAGGLEVARTHNIPAITINPKTFSDKERYESEIVSQLNQASVDLVILAGYMRLVGQVMLNAFPKQIMNIHPSLLPKFKGLNAQKQALDAKESESGCTVHFVDKTLDGGPIIDQEIVKIYPNDTEESLSSRILKKEHILYSRVIDAYIRNFKRT
ncbi:phosphoribosylglycinamide formyltransferase [Candidatus Marinamargulisbacteria bacterium SCGC AG-439-L15]|nr:phosphoribosylglycinamide formyltransferase [Candidatus Marinamargulisbacteria bacterium SCGC AG-439-L15]